mmetsp:Transcript_78572/g.218164  ORF Transcript_78572/g.218164 Transcript_78572/m.218164 type:complete len:229 (+) Transcript_78572:380-1066(+)
MDLVDTHATILGDEVQTRTLGLTNAQRVAKDPQAEVDKCPELGPSWIAVLLRDSLQTRNHFSVLDVRGALEAAHPRLQISSEHDHLFFRWFDRQREMLLYLIGDGRIQRGRARHPRVREATFQRQPRTRVRLYQRPHQVLRIITDRPPKNDVSSLDLDFNPLTGAVEGVRADEHHIEHHPEAPQVHSLAVAFCRLHRIRDLGRPVLRCAYARQGGAVAIVDQLRMAEV